MEIAPLLEEGDVVLCTVDRIVGTNVFATIEEKGKTYEGSITFSEVAPGRIRNIREYVVPKKKIVCKILRISGDRIDLSLRRVTQKEQKEVLESHKQEKMHASMLKSILGEKSKGIIEEIQKKSSLHEFLYTAKDNPKELEKIIGKESASKILDIVKTQKKKTSILKREILLTTTDSEGIALIKKILKEVESKGVEVKYISAGKYSLKLESEDIKKADNEMKEVLEKVEKKVKNKGGEFSILKK